MKWLCGFYVSVPLLSVHLNHLRVQRATAPAAPRLPLLSEPSCLRPPSPDRPSRSPNPHKSVRIACQCWRESVEPTIHPDLSGQSLRKGKRGVENVFVNYTPKQLDRETKQFFHYYGYYYFEKLFLKLWLYIRCWQLTTSLHSSGLSEELQHQSVANKLVINLLLNWYSQNVEVIISIVIANNSCNILQQYYYYIGWINILINN